MVRLLGDAHNEKWEEAVQTLSFGKLLALAAIAAVPLTMTTMAAAQAPAAPAAPAAVAAPAPPPPQMPPSLVPALSVDLMTAPGSAAFGAQWKTMEAKIVERAPLPTHMPGYDKAYDISPHAGEAGYDDSSWPKIDAKELGARRGGGYVSFLWFRANLTIPAKIGEFETAGAKAVLTAYVDDYAEVWINGQMPRRASYPSPAAIQGFNMPNRVVLADQVKAGDQFQIAVFGINGPISVAPANTVFFRQASVEFYK
jgi:gluconolactonase